jgi:hypothetical protein
MKKYFSEVSEAARRRRPRDASEVEGKYCIVWTDLNGIYINVFICLFDGSWL